MSIQAQQLTPIDRVVIESEVRRLLATYVHNLDGGNVDANAELLSDARFLVVDTAVEGRDAIAKFLRTNVQHHADGTPRTSHSLSNSLIDVESPTRATSVTYFTVHQEVDGLPLQPIVTGKYEDTFELRDGRWRFVTRSVQPRLVGVLDHHVAPPTDTAST